VSTARKIEKRHRTAVAAIRKWLHEQYQGHADPQMVTTRQVADALRIYLNTVSTVMTWMSDQPESGLTQVKPGHYEYIWTEDGMANPAPPQPAGRHPRQYRRMDVYEFMREHRGRVYSQGQVAEALSAPKTTVAQALRFFAEKPGNLVPITCVGSGLYLWPLEESERPELPEVLSGVVHANGAIPQPPAPEPPPPPQPPAPEPPPPPRPSVPQPPAPQPLVDLPLGGPQDSQEGRWPSAPSPAEDLTWLRGKPEPGVTAERLAQAERLAARGRELQESPRQWDEPDWPKPESRWLKVLRSPGTQGKPGMAQGADGSLYTVEEF
jgi:hypothetical protein